MTFFRLIECRLLFQLKATPFTPESVAAVSVRKQINPLESVFVLQVAVLTLVLELIVLCVVRLSLFRDVIKPGT